MADALDGNGRLMTFPPDLGGDCLILVSGYKEPLRVCC